jgi:GNAT superfamily N-acetyltransferase
MLCCSLPKQTHSLHSRSLHRMKAKYYRVSRLVVLPDYQGIGVGKRLLNFIAELYTSQTKIPFYILTSNPQITRRNSEIGELLVLGMRAEEKMIQE